VEFVGRVFDRIAGGEAAEGGVVQPRAEVVERKLRVVVFAGEQMRRLGLRRVIDGLAEGGVMVRLAGD
jgi:hypothetical protein